MEWISVKDRLSDKSEEVLALDDEGGIDLAFIRSEDGVIKYSRCRCCTNLMYELTHWMPLPDKP